MPRPKKVVDSVVPTEDKVTHAPAAPTGEEKVENKKPEAKVEDKKPETVTVEKSVIEKMLKDIERLTKAADVSRLSKFDAEDADKNNLIKTAKVSFWDNVPVLAVKTIEDEVYVDSSGVLHETQRVAIFCKDIVEPISALYKDFSRRVVKKAGEIISRKKDSDGNEIMEIRMPNGLVLIIDSKFIN